MKRKMIIITGAAGGIGQPLCHMLAEKQHDLIMLARNIEKLQTLKEQIKSQYEGNFDIFSLDFKKKTEIEAFISFLKAKNISVEGLVIMPPQPIRTKETLPSPKIWQDLFDTSFIQPLELIN